MDRNVTLLGVLALHLTVAILHGTTHALVPVPLPVWQNLLVLGMVFVGPVVGASLVIRNHPLGPAVFTVSMAAAFLLGGVLHFLVENPDHVTEIPLRQWRVAFQASAVGVAITPAIGTAIGLHFWRTQTDQ